MYFMDPNLVNVFVTATIKTQTLAIYFIITSIFLLQLMSTHRSHVAVKQKLSFDLVKSVVTEYGFYGMNIQILVKEFPVVIEWHLGLKCTSLPIRLGWIVIGKGSLLLLLVFGTGGSGASYRSRRPHISKNWARVSLLYTGFPVTVPPIFERKQSAAHMGPR